MSRIAIRSVIPTNINGLALTGRYIDVLDICRILISKAGLIDNRKFHYGQGSSFSEIKPANVSRATVQFLPKRQLVGDPSFNADIKTGISRDKSECALIIELHGDDETPEISVVKMFRWLEVVDEIGALLRAACYLNHTGPESIIGRATMQKTIPIGYVLFSNDDPDEAAIPFETSEYLYDVRLRESDHDTLMTSMSTLVTVWEYDLWPVHRFLKALRSRYIQAESILDLLYAHEGLFAQRASSDYMRMMTMLLLSDNRRRAKEIRELLVASHTLRNDSVHSGAMIYDDQGVKVGGKEVKAFELAAQLKVVVAEAIYMLIDRLAGGSQSGNLKLGDDDLIMKFIPSSLSG